MRAKYSPIMSFLSLFLSTAALVYCSASGAFPASATLGAKSVRSQISDTFWIERQVLGDGVTPHGVTRTYSMNEGQPYLLSEMMYWCGDQVEWIEFWPSGKVRAHSFEEYLAGPLRYKIYDEDGTLVQYY